MKIDGKVHCLFEQPGTFSTTARTMSWGMCLTTRKNFQKTYKSFT